MLDAKRDMKWFDNASASNVSTVGTVLEQDAPEVRIHARTIIVILVSLHLQHSEPTP